MKERSSNNLSSSENKYINNKSKISVKTWRQFPEAIPSIYNRLHEEKSKTDASLEYYCYSERRRSETDLVIEMDD